MENSSALEEAVGATPEISFFGRWEFSWRYFSLWHVWRCWRRDSWIRRIWFNVLRQFSFIAIIAIGETFVIVAAGIDLSVGAVAGLAGVVCCAVISGGPRSHRWCHYWPCDRHRLWFYLTDPCAAFLKLPYFIVTLATMSLARGFIYVITQGTPIVNPKSILFRAGTRCVGGRCPLPVVIMFVFVLLGFLLLNRTGFGRNSPPRLVAMNKSHFLPACT